MMYLSPVSSSSRRLRSLLQFPPGLLLLLLPVQCHIRQAHRRRQAGQTHPPVLGIPAVCAPSIHRAGGGCGQLCTSTHHPPPLNMSAKGKCLSPCCDWRTLVQSTMQQAGHRTLQSIAICPVLCCSCLLVIRGCRALPAHPSTSIRVHWALHCADHRCMAAGLCIAASVLCPAADPPRTGHFFSHSSKLQPLLLLRVLKIDRSSVHRCIDEDAGQTNLSHPYYHLKGHYMQSFLPFIV